MFTGEKLEDRKKNGRIQYIDALRGFSMILVVFGHVMVENFAEEDIAVTEIAGTFRMPLFFFVSGFFAFRASEKWSKIVAERVLKLKFQAQIVGMFVFYMLFQYVYNLPAGTFLQEGFTTYWFTVALFHMFIVYFCLAMAEKFMRCDRIVDVGMLLMVGLTLFMVAGFGYYRMQEIHVFRFLSWPRLCINFQFFAAGIFARKYFPYFENLIRKNHIRTTAIVSYVLLLVLMFDESFKNMSQLAYMAVHDELVKYAGLLVIFIFFFNSGTYFDGDSRPSKWLKYVGTRTLDIYYLHYFFIPALPWLATSISDSNGNMAVAQLLIGGGISVAIVCVCLFVSSVIRSSSTLATWLFGAKPLQKKESLKC